MDCYVYNDNLTEEISMNKLEQSQTPLLSRLMEYAQSGVTPFHMPGHKMGKGAPDQWKEFVGKNVLSIDITEVLGTDDLHEPYDVIKEAQILAAQAFGADETYFLVNGTTCGIQAMIMACCAPDDKIAIPRNAHRSIIGGIILSGAYPVYLDPEVDDTLGIALGITVDTVKQVLDDYPDCKAVLLINPTFHGIASSLKDIVDLAHKREVLVLVDEAHGPHLSFHSQLPISAMASGADACAQSSHKLLGSLTQTSLLHVQGAYIDRERLRAMLRLVQSTSPSYILMASLDAARHQMVQEGKAILQRTIDLAERTREEINRIPGLCCMGQEMIKKPSVAALDPTKLLITVKNLGFTGYQADRILREDYQIQMELADVMNILAMITIGDGIEDVQRLVEALRDLANKNIYKKADDNKGYLKLPSTPLLKIMPREAYLRETAFCKLEEARGKISGELVAPYPPGIPVICPGEEISGEIVDYLLEVRASGIHVQGPADVSLQRIKVIE